MNMHNPTRMDHQQIQREAPGNTANHGLWKLLAAAMLILLGMVGVIEFFGSNSGGFAARQPQPQTIVE